MSTGDEILEIERGFGTHADDPGYFEERYADDGMTVLEPARVIGEETAVGMTADEPWSELQTCAPGVRLTKYRVVLRTNGAVGALWASSEPILRPNSAEN